MKCPTCGNNLQIEEETCSYCGGVNPYFASHREEMDHYRREFAHAKRQAQMRSSRFQFTTVKLSVIAILVALNLLLFFAIASVPYSLWKYTIRKDIEKNKTQYMELLKSYEENGEWIELNVLCSEKELHYDDDFDEFEAVNSAGYYYGAILSQLISLYEEGYKDTSYAIERIADSMESWYAEAYRIEMTSEWYDNRYTAVHKDALLRMEEDLHAVLSAYLGMTKEEVSALFDYSKAKKIQIIGEKVAFIDESNKE